MVDALSANVDKIGCLQKKQGIRTDEVMNNNIKPVAEIKCRSKLE